jgi:hypothetical protein
LTMRPLKSWSISVKFRMMKWVMVSIPNSSFFFLRVGSFNKKEDHWTLPSCSSFWLHFYLLCVPGTTSCCVLAAELLREAEKLVTTNRVSIIRNLVSVLSQQLWWTIILADWDFQIHPQTVIEGYRIASKVALDVLDKNARDNSYERGFSTSCIDLNPSKLRRSCSSLICLTQLQSRGISKRFGQHRQDHVIIESTSSRQRLFCKPCGGCCAQTKS